MSSQPNFMGIVNVVQFECSCSWNHGMFTKQKRAKKDTKTNNRERRMSKNKINKKWKKRFRKWKRIIRHINDKSNKEVKSERETNSDKKIFGRLFNLSELFDCDCDCWYNVHVDLGIARPKPGELRSQIDDIPNSVANKTELLLIKYERMPFNRCFVSFVHFIFCCCCSSWRTSLFHILLCLISLYHCFRLSFA